MVFTCLTFDLFNSKMSKQQKNIIYLALILAASTTAFIIFHFFHHAHHEKESEFLTTSPWRETVNINREFVSQVKASQHIEIRSLEKGYLQNIYVDEGQLVKKGQKMFQVSPMFAESEFNKARAEYQLAKIEYDNTAILQKENIVSANELALSKAKLDKAKAEMQLMENHFKFTTIKAPFDGIMDRFYVRLGSLVEEGELLTTLSDNSNMWVYFNVSESDYLDYMKQKKTDGEVLVKLVLANGELFPFVGKIDTIEADFNNEIGNVAFRASFVNPDSLLRHGETGTILLNQKYENVLLIPQKSTFEILDKKFVYVVNEKGEIESRQIEIENEIEHLFIVKSGLDEGDVILLEALGKVRVGQEIKTKKLDVKAVKEGLILEAS